MVLESNSFMMTYGNYLAFAHHYIHVKTWRLRIVTYGTFALILIATLLAFLNIGIDAAGNVLIHTLPIFLVFLVLQVCINYLFPVFGLWAAKRNGAHNHACKAYIDEQHIWTIDAENEYKKPWRSIESVFATRKHILIYFNKSNAFIIPKSAFNSASEADSFIQAAQGFVAASKKSGA